MAETRYLILGGGVAGIAAAEAIRSKDAAGKILLLYDERAGYYSRPGLAYYLTGELTEGQLFPFTDDDFKQLNVERLHTRVERLLPEQRLVELQNGKYLTYDRLLIATGSEAIIPSLPGVETPGVVKLDHLEDARQIAKLARKGRHAVVIGGGITALEIVEGLVCRGVKVHCLLRGDRYWSGVLDEEESRLVEERLQHEGVTLHRRTQAVEILSRARRVAGVRVQDGGVIPCDLAAIAIGVRPRKELAEAAGLRCDSGILVDEQMRTSANDIFSAGDVAQVYDPFNGKYVLDTLWSQAREEGNAAGLSMAGHPAAYLREIPMNVTRLAGLTVTIIGRVGTGRDPDVLGIVRGDSETWRQLPDSIAAQSGFDVNRVRVLLGEKTMIGAVLIGDQTLSHPLHILIKHQVDITSIRQKLLQPGARLADLLVDFWTRIQREVKRAAG